jgi:hypothetical protein
MWYRSSTPSEMPMSIIEKVNPGLLATFSIFNHSGFRTPLAELVT